MGGGNLKRKIGALALVIVLGAGLLAGGCAAPADDNLKLVASTSVIAQIVERIGGDRVTVSNIIPPAQCPGLFDVKPSDIRMLAEGELFLMHGWQGEMFSDNLIASADNPDLVTVVLNVKVGENMNWMAPPVQMAAVDRIAGTLVQADPSGAADYLAAAEAYKAVITVKAAEFKAALAEIDPASVKILVAQKQAGFLAWAGFDIVGTFGAPETMTPVVIKDLVDRGRVVGVELVIDNLQSGENAGIAVAEELGSARVVLSNFCGAFPDTETWEKTVDYNINLLRDALSK
jgi:zinc transport system substrate-binding protein